MKRAFTAWAAVMIGFLGFEFLGCVEKGLKFNIRFDQIQGLKSGDPVMFENNIAGEILDFKYTTEGGFLVEVTVTPAFKAAATRTTRFFIIDHPGLPGRKAIEMISSEKGAPPIASGETVAGDDATASSFIVRFLEKLKDKLNAIGGENRNIEEDIKNAQTWLEKAIEERFKGFKEQIGQLAEEIQKIPAGETLKKLETVIAGLVDALSASSQELKDRVRKEILPLIEKELQELQNRLEKNRPEEDLSPIQTQLERIRTI